MKRLFFVLFIMAQAHGSFSTGNFSMYFTYRHLIGAKWEVTAFWYYNCDYTNGFSGHLLYPIHDTCNFQTKQICNAVLKHFQPNGYPKFHNIYIDYCPNTLTMCDSPFNANGMISWRLVTYMDTLTLPEQCGLYKFSFGSPSQFAYRDPFITNIQDSTWSAYGEALLNADTTLGNNSALWVRPMFAYANADQNTQWYLPVYDEDGDSLVMSLVKPRERDQQAPNPLDTLVKDIDYLSPYTLAEPFGTSGTFEFDPSIPAVRFNATANQLALLCFRVDEYRNGVYLGSTFREALWHTIATIRPNPLRSIQTTTLQNALPGSNDTITVYAGYPMNLCTHYYSTNTNAELRHESNIDTVLTSSNYSVQMIGDTVYTCLNWTPALSDTGYHLLVTTITDTSCVNPGPRIPQDFFYKVIVKKVPDAFSEQWLNAINVYPNPASNTLFAEGLPLGAYTVYNSVGEIIIKGEVNKLGLTVIPLQKWDNGLYILKSKDRYTKFVIQK